MEKWLRRIIFLTAVMTCFSVGLSVAQPKLTTSVNKNEILIGDQFTLKIEASFSPEEYKIKWPALPDSLAHFEVVNKGKIDSLYSNERLTGLVQTFTLTSFDSGKWTIPSFLVTLTPEKDDTTYNLFTDSVPVTVSFSVADTTNVLKDIKPIREVETPGKLWYWVGGGVLLVALLVLAWWLFKKYRKEKKPETIKTKSSPYAEAMTELQKLNGYDLSAPPDTRIVHTRMGEILKRYLSRVQRSDFSDKTTSEVLMSLRDHYLDKDLPAKAAACMRCSDAVKFAKYQPPVAESNQCLVSIKEVISDIQKQQDQQAKAAAAGNLPKK